MRLLLFLFLLFFSKESFSQEVDKAGDFWHLKVDSALVLIGKTDSVLRESIRASVERISMWNGTYSTNTVEKGKKGTIYISSKDFSLNSINNIAAVIVHESLHVYFGMHGYRMSTDLEEKLCYSLELQFLQKIPDVEPWLIEHAKREIEKRN
jgi:hypothetical protein